MAINGDCPFRNPTEETIYHIFRDCDFAINIWMTITDNCYTSINTNLGIVDWLEYLWNNILWYNKIYGDVLEKVITIFWAIWTYRNNTIFKNEKCNPMSFNWQQRFYMNIIRVLLTARSSEGSQ